MRSQRTECLTRAHADIWQKFAHEIYKAGGAGEGGKRYKPMGGLMRFMALAELTRQGVCTRLDVYGLSGLGGGKYFRRTAQAHHRALDPEVHHGRGLQGQGGLLTLLGVIFIGRGWRGVARGLTPRCRSAS